MKTALVRFGVLLGALFLFASPSFAAESAGVADTMLGTFKTHFGVLTTVALAAGKSLFWVLIVLEICRGIYMRWLDDNMNDIGALMLYTVKVILVPLIFYRLMVNSQEYLGMILGSFMKIASNGLAGLGGADAFSPSKVLELGLVAAGAVLSNTGLVAALTSPLISFTAVLTVFILIAAFAVLAAQLMMAMVEFYIVMTAAPIYIAFGALAFTRDWATKVFSHAVGTGMKVMICGFLASACIRTGEDWGTQLATANLLLESNKMVEILGGALIMLMLAFFIPSIASAITGGNTSLGAGTAIGGALGVAGGAAAAAAAATGGLGGAGSALKDGAGGATSKILNALSSGSMAAASTAGAGAGGGGEGGATNPVPPPQGGSPTPSGTNSAPGTGKAVPPPASSAGSSNAIPVPPSGGAAEAPSSVPPSAATGAETSDSPQVADSSSGGTATHVETPEPVSGATPTAPTGSDAVTTPVGDASGASIGGSTTEKPPKPIGKAARTLKGVADLSAHARENVIDDTAQAGANINLSGHN